MKRNKLNYYLDFLPLLILAASAVVLIIRVVKEGTFFLPKHIAGLIILIINIWGFIWRHRIGVLTLGLTLFLGLFGALSFNYAVTIHTFYVGQIPIFYGQPIFVLWLILHFLISSRNYEGIFSKKYWMNFLDT